MKATSTALAVTGALLLATPAHADEVLVGYSDLDLSSAKDRRTFKERIDIAARKVCGFHEHVTGTRIRSRGTTDCYAQAKARAMQSFAAIVAESRFGG